MLDRVYAESKQNPIVDFVVVIGMVEIVGTVLVNS